QLLLQAHHVLIDLGLLRLERFQIDRLRHLGLVLLAQFDLFARALLLGRELVAPVEVVAQADRQRGHADGAQQARRQRPLAGLAPRQFLELRGQPAAEFFDIDVHDFSAARFAPSPAPAFAPSAAGSPSSLRRARLIDTPSVNSTTWREALPWAR